jgi:hypothetical protein
LRLMERTKASLQSIIEAFVASTMFANKYTDGTLINPDAPITSGAEDALIIEDVESAGVRPPSQVSSTARARSDRRTARSKPAAVASKDATAAESRRKPTYALPSG